jgi:hypothetical protein
MLLLSHKEIKLKKKGKYFIDEANKACNILQLSVLNNKNIRFIIRF